MVKVKVSEVRKAIMRAIEKTPKEKAADAEHIATARRLGITPEALADRQAKEGAKIVKRYLAGAAAAGVVGYGVISSRRKK